MARFAITGGAGFIGSNIAEKLITLGHSVKIIDNFSSGSMENLEAISKDVEIHKIDIRNLEALKNAFKNVDFVYHEAAIPSVQLSIEDPILTEENNVVGTINVLTAARHCDIKRLVFASSAAVYGDSPKLPKSEEMMPEPMSPYALHKLSGEYYLKMFNRLYGVETVCLRYFNVFGPRQNPGSPYSGVISIFIDKMLKGERPIIYGDGQQTRDFVFIDNVVNANISAALSETVGQGEIINVATGQASSLNDLIHSINSILGTEIKAEYKESRAGDIRHSVASIENAARLLNNKADVNLKEGLAKLIKSLRYK